MPIKGLSQRAPSFPEIGILRKGGKKRKKVGRDGREVEIYGADLTYFRFTSDDEAAVAAFYAAHPAEPREIEIVLPHATTDENWSDWMEHWVAGGLKHRCDGETCILWQKPDGSYSQEPKPCPGGCAPVGRLKVILPKLRRLAYVTVLTGSKLDIINLGSQLRALEAIRGDLRGIPMILSRHPRMVSTPDAKTKKRVRREKWLLSIEAAPHWVDLQLEAQHTLALPIPAGYANGDDEDEVIVDAITGEVMGPQAGPDWTDELVEAGEAEPEPEPEEQPEPEPPPEAPSNGFGSFTQAELMRATKTLLSDANNRTMGKYNDTADLFKLFRKELGDDFGWPHPKDAAAWAKLLELAAPQEG